MKKDIHPKYNYVIFRDINSGTDFFTRSTMSSDQKVRHEDGKEYPVIQIETSSASHPFFVGKSLSVKAKGRVDKFNKRYNKA